MANLIEDILESYANKIIDALQSSLEKSGRYGAGTFAQSIIALPIKVLGGSYVMEIEMDEYWKFIDEGVDGWEQSRGSQYKYKKNGKPIPITAMKRFIATAGIKPKVAPSTKRKGLKKSKTTPYDSLAWALGYSIKRKGLRKTNFATDVFESQLIKDMQRDVLKAIGKEIRIEIKKDIK